MPAKEAYNYQIAHNEYGAFAVPMSSAYTYTSRAIMAGRVHEPTTIDFIVQNNGGKDIIHAGAGFGDFLPALSKGCSGTIWAFEPNKENYFCARKTLELNGLHNVNIRNHGLGHTSSDALLKVKEAGLALGPRSEICTSHDRHDEVDSCKLFKLDDLFPENDFSIIHLDVEGYEFPILDGARNIIERCSPLIILEIDDRALKYNSYMAAIGYEPIKQLVYDAQAMVFVNTVYARVAGA